MTKSASSTVSAPARGHRLGIRVWHPRLKQRLVLFILTAGIAAGAVTLGFIYFIGTATLTTTIGRSFQELASTTSSNISALIDHHLEESRLLASAYTVLSTVEESNAFYGTEPSEEITRRIAEIDERWRQAQAVDAFFLEIQGNRATTYLEDFTAQTPDPSLYHAIWVTNSYGALVAKSGRVSHYAYGERPWWKEAYHGGQGQPFVSGIEADPEIGVNVLVVAMPIVKDQQAVGVLAMVFPADTLLRPAMSAKIGTTDHTMLVTQGGTVLFCPVAPVDRHVLSPDQIRAVTQPDVGWSSTITDVHYPGRESLNGHAPVAITKSLGGSNFNGNTWYVFTSQDPRESYAPVFTLLRWTTVAGIVGTAIFTLFGFLIARRIVRPIQALQTGAELIGQGNLSHRIDIATGDEIEDLANQFNKMAHKLKLFYIGLEENVKEKSWKLEHSNKELFVLYSIAGTLNQALPLKDLLDETLKKMLDVMEADGGVIWMADPPPGSSPITATKLPVLTSQQMSSLIELIHHISRLIRERGELWLSENLAVDGRLDQLRHSDPGYISLAAIPLMSRDHVLGILFLLYREIRALTSREEKLLTSVGVQIGGTIEHVELAAQTSRSWHEPPPPGGA